jgi:hypothetical protein
MPPMLKVTSSLRPPPTVVCAVCAAVQQHLTHRRTPLQVGALAWLAEEAEPPQGAAFRTVCAACAPDVASRPEAAYLDRITREKAAALMRLYFAAEEMDGTACARLLNLPLFEPPSYHAAPGGTSGSSEVRHAFVLARRGCVAPRRNTVVYREAPARRRSAARHFRRRHLSCPNPLWTAARITLWSRALQAPAGWWHDTVLDRLARAAACAAIDFYISPHAAQGSVAPASLAAQQAEREGRDVAAAAQFRPAQLRQQQGGDVAIVDMLQRHAVRQELNRCAVMAALAARILP